MSKKRKAPKDSPSTLKDPDYVKRRRAQMKAEQQRYNDMCGPVETRKAEKK